MGRVYEHNQLSQIRIHGTLLKNDQILISKTLHFIFQRKSSFCQYFHRKNRKRVRLPIAQLNHYFERGILTTFSVCRTIEKTKQKACKTDKQLQSAHSMYHDTFNIHGCNIRLRIHILGHKGVRKRSFNGVSTFTSKRTTRRRVPSNT